MDNKTEENILKSIFEYFENNEKEALVFITAAFVSFVELSVEQNGGCPKNEIVIEPETGRKITIHTENENAN